MDKIDKFVYINLDKREDRKKHILSELKKFNIPDEKIIRFSAVEHLKGQIGCGLSHIGVMEMFKKSGDKIWCILEDDNVFTKNLEETNLYINEFLSNNQYDVFLGCTACIKAKNIKGSDKIIRVMRSKMTSFYIARSNVADAMIASHKQSIRSYGTHFYKKGIPIDVMWFNLMKVFVFVTSYFNPLGAQLVGYSDIMHKNKDYNGITKTKTHKLEESDLSEKEKDSEFESL